MVLSNPIADLAGFTSWSSKRTPSDVFEMLELIYAAMDALALKRGVYKVETIGDCYMAVTGLPKPQANHAERMVRFSRDALAKLKKFQENPEYDHLGLKELSFRVGMHSGGVTAGIIRGDRARFQVKQTVWSYLFVCPCVIILLTFIMFLFALALWGYR